MAAAPGLPSETTVLVVGGGPVGLLCSVLLGAQGVDHRVVERRDGLQRSPAAHVVNARTFEILRAAGVDPHRLAAAAQPAADGAWVRWVTTLTGDELGRVPFELLDRPGALDEVTPTPLRNLSQHRLEPILRDHAGPVHPGVEWESAELVEGGVVSTLRDLATGGRTEVASRYLVAADGAGSPVRRWAGIAMDGPTRLASFVSIHCEVDLRHLVADRPATLYWVMDPDVTGTFVAHDLDGTWVFMHTVDPDTEDLATYTPERCAELFRRATGVDDLEVTVRTVTPWTMTAQVAERYRTGPVFLVGDAAHRFPPTGGLGLNTGAADVHNLAWKLGAVERGWADPGLLDTYEAERRPVARDNASSSLENAVRLVEVPLALGLDGDPAGARDRYQAVLASAEGRQAVRRAAEDQAAHFDMLGLHLGYAYPPGSGPVVDDGSPPEPPADPVRTYVPSTRPGGRLPHAWVDRDGARCSTLDLVPLDRFVLLTASPDWAAAARWVARGPVPLDVVEVGADVVDDTGGWSGVAALGTEGAVLVRPDQHVAWRTREGAGDPAAVLHDVLAGLVGDRAGTG